MNRTTVCGDAAIVCDVASHAPDDWQQLLLATAAVDYSQTQHWQDVICRHRPGARQVWLTARRNGALVGGLAAIVTPAVRRLGGLIALHRIDSSVDGVSGGPLLHPALSEAEQLSLASELVQLFLAQRPAGLASAAVALNAGFERRLGEVLTPAQGWRRRSSPTAVVSLAGGPEVVARDRLVVNKRNERNRGLRRGAEVFATSDPDLLGEYYPIYEKASAHWGVPPLSLDLLSDLLADPDGRVFFTCVRLENRVIGGHLCLHLGDFVFAWHGVTDPEFARSHFPATLCFWGDIVEACQRGARWLDFGASGGVNSLSGFKKYFGAELMERGFYVNDSSSMAVLRRGQNMMKRMQIRRRGRWHDGATGDHRRGHGQ